MTLGDSTRIFGIPVQMFAVGRMVEDTLLPSCILHILGWVLGVSVQSLPDVEKQNDVRCFQNRQEQVHGELSFLTNLLEGSLDR